MLNEHDTLLLLSLPRPLTVVKYFLGGAWASWELLAHKRSVSVMVVIVGMVYSGHKSKRVGRWGDQ